MGIPARVRQVYDAQLPVLEALEVILRETLRPWCEDKRYLFRGRLKEPESLSEKLETGRFESWDQIDDLYAATIVVPTATHEPNVLAFLSSAFREQEVRGRHTAQKPPDVFRFDATRFIGRLREQPGLERPAGIEQVLFEIQIATAFESAWSVATHDLVYKANTVDWQRIRLAAQLKAAVEQIDMLIDNFERSADSIPLSEHRDTALRREIVDVCERLITDGKLPDSLRPESWARFADNVYSLIRSSKGRRVHDGVRDVLRALEERVNAAPHIPVSGSLFQMILEVAIGLDASALDEFVVVDSEELAQLHGITEVPKPFNFGDVASEVE